MDKNFLMKELKDKFECYYSNNGIIVEIGENKYFIVCEYNNYDVCYLSMDETKMLYKNDINTIISDVKEIERMINDIGG